MTALGVGFLFYFLYQVPSFLKKIAAHLYRIKLLLEFQNPMYDAEDLWQFDQVAKFWDDWNDKYFNDDSEANKELRDLIFHRRLAQYRSRNLMRQHYYHAIEHKGDVDKIDEKLEDELSKLDEEMRDMEEKISKLSPKIKEALDKKGLDLEFGHRWRYHED